MVISDEFNLTVDDSQFACIHVNCESLHRVIEINLDLKMMIIVMMMMVMIMVVMITKRRAFLIV